MLDVAVSFLTTGVLPAVGILVTLGVLNLFQRRPGEFAIPVIATLLCIGILLLLWPPSIFTYLIVVPAVGFGMLLVWSTALGAKQRFLDRLSNSSFR